MNRIKRGVVLDSALVVGFGILTLGAFTSSLTTIAVAASVLLFTLTFKR